VVVRPLLGVVVVQERDAEEPLHHALMWPHLAAACTNLNRASIIR
jgi:hypothetical protein